MGRWTWMVRLTWSIWILSWPLENEWNWQNIFIRKDEGMISAKNTHKYNATDESLWYTFITKNLNLLRTTKLLTAIDLYVLLNMYITWLILVSSIILVGIMTICHFPSSFWVKTSTQPDGKPQWLNHMEQRPSWNVKRSKVVEKFRLSWNPNVHYCSQKQISGSEAT
jgi:hypothetical protein